MAKIIDNKKETLAFVLNKEFSEVDEIAIASAYFNVRGYGAIAQGLGDKPMKLLLGREPTETIKWEDEILQELEQFEDDADYFRLLQKTIQYFKDDKRLVRIMERRFFHGKAFIGVSLDKKEVRRGIGVVGSSNLTYGGLVSNRELNMLNTDREVVQELAEWFEEQWNQSRDFKEEFISLLSNYVTSWSPYEVVAKALYETYKGSLIERETKMLKHLYPHQQLTYIDAKEKLEKYGGVLIADSTGLGKSRVALALAHEAIREGIRPLLIAPKSILETTWEAEMNETLVRIDTLSTEMLSQNPDIVDDYVGEKGPELIIVDEAHYFRRSSTNRYIALRELVNKNQAKIVLITATPVNTSLMDLYSLLSLYLPENCIADLNHQSLYEYFVTQQRRWLAGEPINMDDILRRFIVRHSRELAKALDREGRIRFPKRVFDEKIGRYPITISLDEIYKKLENLSLAFYDLSIERLSAQFRLPDGTRIEKKDPTQVENLKNLVKTIFIINLFKRLESSYAAFEETLRRMLSYIRAAKHYATKFSVFIPPKMRGDILNLFPDVEEREDEIPFEEFPAPEELFSKPRYKGLYNECKLSKQEAEEFVANCSKDEEAIESLLRMLPNHDEKYFLLERRLQQIMKQIKEPNGVIIFTQYADTAHYLYRRLKASFNRVMLVTGAGGYNDKGEKALEDHIVRRFQKVGGLLISTDVLSAGQNLQNAQYVANYDFPWNPVVLIQRVGRIDRIGSNYDIVYLINVLPRNGDPDDPESLEHFLGLMQRLYKRLEMIRGTIGLDASTLGEEAAPRDFSIQAMIARNDERVLKILEQKIEQFTKDPIDILARILNEKGLQWVERIPNGIGAIKRGTLNGIFALLTDGDNFYWRLHVLDKDKEKIITSPTEIVDLLLEGESDNRGEKLEYDKLIPLLVMVKESLKKELEEVMRRETTAMGPPRVDKKTRTVFDALSQLGDEGERLASMFRRVASKPAIVNHLYRAYLEGKLLEEARKILPKAVQEIATTNPETKELRRVCWCYFTKT
ncbi:helicase domain-containing protein [Candidatus Caldarchaeum subterraneum]|uniref:Helicase n=1 Tax=Caldiarchaeum subterraneum TaxID=311458 RepID=E6N3A1_CALS0|nr:helicase [Candidatus Caldarchaeum subterraneum]BAJ49895.1 helicase domain-containing protein [Candidatus Caldarchaeum subterraneum]